MTSNILQYLLITNHDQVSGQLKSFCDIPRLTAFAQFQDIIDEAKRGLTWLQRLSALANTLRHENLLVLERTLGDIQSILQTNQSSLLARLWRDTIDSELASLMDTLLDLSRKYSGISSEIQSLAYRCIGHLGAIDPAKLDFGKPQNSNSYNFTPTDDAIDFTCFFLQARLVPEYQSAANLQVQSLLAYTIQELLRFAGFSSCSKGTDGSLSMATPQLQSKWDNFPKKMIDILSPLLFAKYSVRDSKETNLSVPIFSRTSSMNEWAHATILYTIQNLSGRLDFHSFFKILKAILKETEINLVDQVLPLAVLHGIIDQEVISKSLHQEFLAILSGQLHTQMKPDQQQLILQVFRPSMVILII